MPALAVIVPLAAGETAWQQLLPQLQNLAIDKEILLLCADSRDVGNIVMAMRGYSDVRVHAGGNGRAALMNAGAAMTNAKHLWFVHADTVLPDNCATVLARAMRGMPALYYFDLAFLPDGPALMAINAAGACLRSRCLKMPFGDQAFLIEKSRFAKIGGFDEQAEYGEDHLLVWQARRSGLPVMPMGACVQTSARKYRQQGWGRVTLRHLWLTLQQAWPQYLQLWRQRLRQRG